jgi:hypothetical protein
LCGATTAEQEVPLAETSTIRRLHDLLGLSQLGYAWWFFGNLYEEIVQMPERIANGNRLTSILVAGSPVWYYAPGALLILATTVSAVLLGRRARIEQPALLRMTVCVFVGILATVYLVPTVNLRLFVVGPSVDTVEQVHLLRRWHTVNYVRLVMTAGGGLIAARIRGRLCRVNR